MGGYRPITDTWMTCRPKVKYYGAYPAGSLERMRYLLGVTINDPILHICGGRVKEYQSGPMKGKGLGPNDRTLDLDGTLEPDFHMDARTIGVNPGDTLPYWTCDPSELAAPWIERQLKTMEVGTFDVEKGGEGPWRPDALRFPWAACLIDRPYTDADAEHYAPGDDWAKNLNDLVRRALSITRIGGRVGILDYLLPRPPTNGVAFIANVTVTMGWNNRHRCYSVFERTAHNPLEFNVTIDADGDEAEDIPEPAPAGGVATKKKKKKKKRTKKKLKKKKLRPRPSAMDGFA